jgi:RNA polymerase sigma-70 factor, ECF subfamily
VPPAEGVMTRDLVERARRGDHDAFATLAGAAVSRLDATAWLMLRDTDRAMDAVQSALIRAWRDLPALRDPDRFDAWLYRLVIHACTDEIRRGRRHRFDVDIGDLTTDPLAPDAISTIADRDQIERGFSRLAPEERAVIVLHHYLDLPLPEVASTLQIPLGTVKSRLYRGLRQMRAVLDADARAGSDLREGRPA